MSQFALKVAESASASTGTVLLELLASKMSQNGIQKNFKNVVHGEDR